MTRNAQNQAKLVDMNFRYAGNSTLANFIITKTHQDRVREREGERENERERGREREKLNPINSRSHSGLIDDNNDDDPEINMPQLGKKLI